jgi:hypothetical protein
LSGICWNCHQLRWLTTSCSIADILELALETYFGHRRLQKSASHGLVICSTDSFEQCYYPRFDASSFCSYLHLTRSRWHWSVGLFWTITL